MHTLPYSSCVCRNLSPRGQTASLMCSKLCLVLFDVCYKARVTIDALSVYVQCIIFTLQRLLPFVSLVLCKANLTDMYKGIGQYFPFHVEMNPFQRDKTAFTLGYTVRILGKHLLFLYVCIESKKGKHLMPHKKVYLKVISTISKSKTI